MVKYLVVRTRVCDLFPRSRIIKSHLCFPRLLSRSSVTITNQWNLSGLLENQRVTTFYFVDRRVPYAIAIMETRKPICMAARPSRDVYKYLYNHAYVNTCTRTSDNCVCFLSFSIPVPSSSFLLLFPFFFPSHGPFSHCHSFLFHFSLPHRQFSLRPPPLPFQSSFFALAFLFLTFFIILVALSSIFPPFSSFSSVSLWLLFSFSFFRWSSISTPYPPFFFHSSKLFLILFPLLFIRLQYLSSFFLSVSIRAIVLSVAAILCYTRPFPFHRWYNHRANLVRMRTHSHHLMNQDQGENLKISPFALSWP